MRDEAAAVAGVHPDTWSGYVSRGQAPAPTRKIGRTPLWDEDEVGSWAQNRPGRGSRTTPRARAREKTRGGRTAAPAAEET